jgi:hypothetical protein
LYLKAIALPETKRKIKEIEKQTKLLLPCRFGFGKESVS